MDQGLRIDPSQQASAIGCNFGKGLYFADVLKKSIAFCYPHETNNIGLVLLCEVALGNSYKCVDIENIEILPEGTHSVHGIGSSSPQSKEILDDGVIIPLGEPVQNDNNNQITMAYNEFVIYNEAQVKIKYLLKFKVNQPVQAFE